MNNYCQALFKKPFSQICDQNFTFRLITTAFIDEPCFEDKNLIQSIKTTLTTVMIEDIHQLSLSTIKRNIGFIVNNSRFTYYPFFITLLKNLLDLRNTAVENYILTDLKPRLLKHGKAQNAITHASLASLKPKHPKMWALWLLNNLIIQLGLSVCYISVPSGYSA